VSPADVGAEIGIDRRHAKVKLRQLVERGDVAHMGIGRYRLADPVGDALVELDEGGAP
jgi:hypothetical protein